jgi:hypothetical protein
MSATSGQHRIENRSWSHHIRRTARQERKIMVTWLSGATAVVEFSSALIGLAVAGWAASLEIRRRRPTRARGSGEEPTDEARDD